MDPRFIPAKREYNVPAVKVAGTVDPTGCGDAYRAGLLYGLMAGHDIETCARIASLTGGIKVESHGTQNHQFTREIFAERFQKKFRSASSVLKVTATTDERFWMDSKDTGPWQCWGRAAGIFRYGLSGRYPCRGGNGPGSLFR